MLSLPKHKKILLFSIVLFLICYLVLIKNNFIQNIHSIEQSQSSENFELNAVFSSTSNNETSNSLTKYGSYVKGDSTIGQFTSDWYEASGKVHIMVAGYPTNEGNKLEIQFNNSNQPIIYQDNNPGEKWTDWSFFVGKDTTFRIVAQDHSIKPAGWLGISLPYKSLIPTNILMIFQFILGSLYLILFLIPGIVLASYVSPFISAKPLFLLVSLAGSFGIGYFIFYIYYFNPMFGKISSYLILTSSLFLLYIRYNKIVNHLKNNDYIYPLILVILQSLFYLSLLFSLHTDIDPHIEIEGRFLSYSLPTDNIIPYLFLDRIFNGSSVSPFLGDWLSSDRPPLLTGVLALIRSVSIFQSPELLYQIMGTFIQSTWIIGVWALIRNKKWNNNTLFLSLGIILFSGWSLINTNFLWPKMSTIPMIILAYILLLQNKRTKMDVTVGSLACAFAFLLHGGSVFSILAIGSMLLFKIYRLTWKEIGLGIVMFMIAVFPWTLYQKFIDPPGDRLLKWQLAGKIEVTDKSFFSTLFEAYRSIPFSKILEFKISNFMNLFPTINSISSISGIQSQFFNNFILISGITNIILLLAVLYLIQHFKLFNWKSAVMMMMYNLLISLFIWSILLFGPDATSVHQGSYTNNIFVFLLFSIALSKYPTWLGLSIYYLNLIVFCSLWWINNHGSFSIYFWDPFMITFCIMLFISILFYLHFIHKTLLEIDI